MFRRACNALGRRRPTPTAPPLTHEVRAPDPYVWRLPTPHDARWRRWARRNRAAGFRLPLPDDEDCWPTTPAHPHGPLWETADDVVRPYVLNR